jgi:hypothetical protein
MLTPLRTIANTSLPHQILSVLGASRTSGNNPHHAESNSHSLNTSVFYLSSLYCTFDKPIECYLR